MTVPTVCQLEFSGLLPAARKKIWLPATPWVKVMVSVGVRVFPPTFTELPVEAIEHWLLPMLPEPGIAIPDTDRRYRPHRPPGGLGP